MKVCPRHTTRTFASDRQPFSSERLACRMDDDGVRRATATRPPPGGGATPDRPAAQRQRVARWTGFETAEPGDSFYVSYQGSAGMLVVHESEGRYKCGRDGCSHIYVAKARGAQQVFAHWTSQRCFKFFLGGLLQILSLFSELERARVVALIS